MATTLADHLRSRSDEELGALLRLRPDLVMPVPADLATLAARAQSRVSVARVLDQLDEFTLRVLDAGRLTRTPDHGTTSVAAILAMARVPGGDGPVQAALDRLRARFLLYGPDPELRLCDGVDEASSPYPAELGHPAADLDPRVAARCADPAQLRRTLLTAPPAARAVLDRLAAGPPLGSLSDEPPAPVRWLIEAGLLAVVDNRSAAGGGRMVELPREVGLLLRRDTGPLGPLRTAPPTVSPTGREVKVVDSAGAGQAMELVRQTGAVLEALAAEPAPVLRSGGLGVRDLRRLSRAAALDETTIALLMETAHSAGLIGEAEVPSPASRTVERQVLPTGGYDVWLTESVATRWERLARAWLAMTRRPGLIGQRDGRDRPIVPLSGEAERAGAPAIRAAALGVLAGLDSGATPTADEVLTLLAWRTPRQCRGREENYRESLDEAARLGITGLGGLTSYGRLLLADACADPEEPADEDPLGLRGGGRDPQAGASPTVRVLDGLLPAPVDHVLVQADLTVIVPGPPEPDLAAELEIIAEPESAGAASVHRVTPTSVRRALDAGYHADDLHELLRRRSRTPVPQGLTYLIDDAARTHGGLRAGAAGSYLRSDDEAVLAEALADRKLAGLALRRLAPTVLVTPYQAGRLLDALRAAGYAPVAEDTSGAAVRGRPKVRRAPTRLSVAVRAADRLALPRLTGPRVLGIVEQIRRGDAAARAARRAPATIRAANGQVTAGLTAVQAHSQALAVLQQAIRDRSVVWVAYVDAHGATVSRLVRPVSLGGGYLRAEDERTETLHTFALHRVTAAVVEG